MKYELEEYPEDKTEPALEKHVAPAIRAHMKDFLAAIESRGKPVADIEQGYISTTACVLANLSQQLFEHKRITTTETKAKRLRPLAERLITFAKRGDLAARRRVLTVVRDKGVVHTHATEIAPAVAERQGGYTRITKIGPRKGDNAPMAVIELVLEPLSPKQAVVREAEKTAAKSAPKKASTKDAAAAPAAEEPAADEAAVEETTEAPAAESTEAPAEDGADKA